MNEIMNNVFTGAEYGGSYGREPNIANCLRITFFKTQRPIYHLQISLQLDHIECTMKLIRIGFYFIHQNMYHKHVSFIYNIL